MSEDRDRLNENDEEVKDEDVEAHRNKGASAEETVETVEGDDDVEAHRFKSRFKN
jgi:hypothetical protein